MLSREYLQAHNPQINMMSETSVTWEQWCQEWKPAPEESYSLEQPGIYDRLNHND